MTIAVYVHWPYCTRICPYCDFNVYKARGDDAALVDAICADLAHWREVTGPQVLASIHFGGGTPSLMRPADISRIIDLCTQLWSPIADIEIGLEANPADIDRLADIRAAGVERLSLGVQSLDDAALKRLGRDHDSTQARTAITTALDLFPRTSIDLITAREGLTVADWRAELGQALTYPLQHISVYQLTIEPGTAYDRAARRGTLKPPSHAASADMYEATIETLFQAGFAHYEISNFARDTAQQSRHNLIYWRSGTWVGVGPGAHGRLGDDAHRTGQIAHKAPKAYIDAVAATGCGTTEVETLTPRDSALEILLMGLRLEEGIDKQRLAALKALPDDTTLNPLITSGWLAPSPDRLIPTPLGRQMLDQLVLSLT